VRTLRYAFFCGVLVAISGCASNFTCPAPASGLKCSPVSVVYDKAMSGEIMTTPAVDAKSTQKKQNKQAEVEPVDKPQMPSTASGRLHAEKMVPLRVPPKIIRIWLAPWEDDDGDLIQGGYVYSEISDPKNRWVIGEKKQDGGKKHMRFFSGKAPERLKEGTVERSSLVRDKLPEHKDSNQKRPPEVKAIPVTPSPVRPPAKSTEQGKAPDNPPRSDNTAGCPSGTCPIKSSTTPAEDVASYNPKSSSEYVFEEAVEPVSLVTDSNPAVADNIAKRRATVRSRKVNMRSGPGLAYRAKGKAVFGEVFNVNGSAIGEDGDIWYSVLTQNGECWIRGTSLNVVQEKPSEVIQKI